MTQSFVQQLRAQGRVFALTQQDARKLNIVVECMIILAGHTARVLFDIDATHSFISDKFASKFNQPLNS